MTSRAETLCAEHPCRNYIEKKRSNVNWRGSLKLGVKRVKGDDVGDDADDAGRLCRTQSQAAGPARGLRCLVVMLGAGEV